MHLKLNLGSMNPFAEQEVSIETENVVDAIMESDMLLHLVQRRVEEIAAFGAGLTDIEFFKTFDGAVTCLIENEIMRQSAREDDYLEGA